MRPPSVSKVVIGKSRSNKYGAKATVIDGVRFASKAEAERDAELQILLKAKLIRDLRRQPRYPLIVRGKKVATYVGDWEYREGNRLVVEDKKGVKTAVFRLKWRLVQVLYPEIEWRIS